MITVWSTKGTGSAIAEAFLKLGAIPFKRELINYEEPHDNERLVKINPLAQVPTLQLDTGEILTETLAIMNFVHRHAPTAHLIPSNYFVKFQRWVTMLVTAVYPTWTYGDVPKKWVNGAQAEFQLRLSTDEHRKKLWAEFEKEIKGPFFLGDQLCAIDIYIAVMYNWRPGKKWFDETLPAISKLAKRVHHESKLIEIFDFHFPE